MNEGVSITSAFTIGLLGGVHCIGMCGGIVNALSFAISDKKPVKLRITTILLLYNTGRIFSYSIAGAVIGGMGWWLQGKHQFIGTGLRIFAGLMLVAMGLYLAGWWRGLTHLEKMGGSVWKYIQPVAVRMMPVSNGRQAFMLGMLWGWLPCGLVYSTLIFAATAADWQQSTIIMACFGLGTLPSLLISGVMAHQLKEVVQKVIVRNVVALFVIVFGIWTLITPIVHLNHHQIESLDLTVDQRHTH